MNNDIAVKIEALILEKISISKISIIDDSYRHRNHKKDNQGGHFKLLLVSDVFENLNLIKRHQLIYNILDSMIKKDVHALSMQLLSVDEYKKLSN